MSEEPVERRLFENGFIGEDGLGLGGSSLDDRFCWVGRIALEDDHVECQVNHQTTL